MFQSSPGWFARNEQPAREPRAETHIIPGHGVLATREVVTASVRVLQTVREQVVRTIAFRDNVVHVITTVPLAEFEARWDGPIDQTRA